MQILCFPTAVFVIFAHASELNFNFFLSKTCSGAIKHICCGVIKAAGAV
jgi:hypothetical protein